MSDSACVGAFAVQRYSGIAAVVRAVGRERKKTVSDQCFLAIW